jgi:hypothetical protein
LARAGDDRGATEAIKVLFSRPTLYQPSLAWCDLMLAPLRKDARYREFLASRGVDLTIDPMRRDTWPRDGVAH